MRVSTLVKNVFSETMEFIPQVVTKKALANQVKTNMVLVDPDVIAKLFKFFVSKGNVEGTSLLRGTICGTYLLVKGAHCCEDLKATPISASVGTQFFNEASEIDDGNYVVGLAHSHVGSVPVFMSEPDQRTQKGFQALFSDAVALVMNPFMPDGVCFRFYRIEEGKAKQLPHGFLVGVEP
ncbi:MAG: hypothetical protein JW840_09500 [Candidatus Thermoplasmatota archaeon]|nr:hypothetical protein [Candidatus Thermoplasmatota archaeon]